MKIVIHLFFMKIGRRMSNNKKTWKSCLVVEIILGISYIIGTLFAKHEAYQVFLIVSALIIVGIALVLLVFYKNYAKNSFTRWYLFLTLTLLIQSTWCIWLNFCLNKVAVAEVFIVIIFYLCYPFIMFPLVKLIVAKINWVGARIVSIIWLMLILFDNSGWWNFKIDNRILKIILTTGLLGGIAFFITGCFIAYNWGYRLNPNLKFKPSVNFSKTVLLVLIAYGIFDVIWNDFAGDKPGLFNAFFYYKILPLQFHFGGFAQAAEAAVLEETFRYLLIITLLARFHGKHGVPIVVWGSGVVFGLLHFGNVGFQQLDATFAQVTQAIGVGIFFAVLYLYSGKLWLTMIFHFLIDYLIFIQHGGNGAVPATWNGTVGDWATVIAAITMPVLIYSWMMFGKRRKVLDENANRLIFKENTLAINE